MSSVLVGVPLSLLALLAAFTLSSGLGALATRVQGEGDKLLGARQALRRIALQVERSGIGVCPGLETDCPDEAIELLQSNALAWRGDRDRDTPSLASIPENWLIGRYPRVATGNGELVVILRRGGSRAVSFDADLNSPTTRTLPDGTPVATRDGRSESIDAGPALTTDDRRESTLDLVTFDDDARRFGTARFRITTPLLDRVSGFRVSGYDRFGAQLGECGGRDDAASRSCRAQLRRLLLQLNVRDAAGRERELREWVRLP